MSQVITLVTSAGTIASNVLTFSSVPITELQFGASVSGFGITAGSYITAFTSYTITINNKIDIPAGTNVTITSNAGAILRSVSYTHLTLPTTSRV